MSCYDPASNSGPPSYNAARYHQATFAGRRIRRRRRRRPAFFTLSVRSGSASEVSSVEIDVVVAVSKPPTARPLAGAVLRRVEVVVHIFRSI